jgi:hypothetical protein
MSGVVRRDARWPDVLMFLVRRRPPARPARTFRTLPHDEDAAVIAVEVLWLLPWWTRWCDGVLNVVLKRLTTDRVGVIQYW